MGSEFSGPQFCGLENGIEKSDDFRRCVCGGRLGEDNFFKVFLFICILMLHTGTDALELLAPSCHVRGHRLPKNLLKI